MKLGWASAAALLAATIGQARAGTIFSTFGSGQSFNSAGTALTINSAENIAADFTSTSATSVGSVALALFGFAPMSLMLESNFRGVPSGVLATVVTGFTPNTATPTVFSFTLATPFSVAANTSYWLVAQSSDPTGDSWSPSTATALAALYESLPGTIWTSTVTTVLAYSLSTPASATVPEPASLPLLGTGMLLALALGARRHKGADRRD